MAPRNEVIFLPFWRGFCRCGYCAQEQVAQISYAILSGGRYIYTARSVEDETRNGHWSAKRNPNRNHETILLGLFLFENLKRDPKR